MKDDRLDRLHTKLAQLQNDLQNDQADANLRSVALVRSMLAGYAARIGLAVMLLRNEIADDEEELIEKKDG